MQAMLREGKRGNVQAARFYWELLAESRDAKDECLSETVSAMLADARIIEAVQAFRDEDRKKKACQSSPPDCLPSDSAEGSSNPPTLSNSNAQACP